MSAAERWTALVTRVLAPNSGPMTLDGTNSFVIGMPEGGPVVVVDPGPLDDAHLDRLASRGPVELILLTHHHHDHVEAAERFAARTGAPVRAFDPRLCVDGAVGVRSLRHPSDGGGPQHPSSVTGALADEELITTTSGIRIRVIATPGHTADSISLHLPDDTALDRPAPGGTMLTGDTILGRGTTIIAHPDGSLAAYLRSLDRLGAFGPIPVLPAHGPMLPDLAGVCARYAAHRGDRLAQVRTALRALGREPSGDPALVAAVTDVVYAGVDPGVRFAAEASMRAQLEYLAGEV